MPGPGRGVCLLICLLKSSFTLDRVYLMQARLKPRKIANPSSIPTGTLRKWESEVWTRSFLISSDERLRLGCSRRRSWSRWVSREKPPLAWRGRRRGGRWRGFLSGQGSARRPAKVLFYHNSWKRAHTRAEG